MVIPAEELENLMDDAEMLADVRAYDAAKARIERGRDELIQLEITERRLAGESTVKIWREYRGITQEDLEKTSKVPRPRQSRRGQVPEELRQRYREGQEDQPQS